MTGIALARISGGGRAFLIKYAVAVGLALSASTAQAAVFELSYTLESGQVLTADIEGILQGDMNTVVVSGVDNAAVNGVLGPPILSVDSVSNFLTGDGAPAVLTLDGSGLNLFAFGPTSTDTFVFDTVLSLFSVPAFTAGSGFGNGFENFNLANYSLTAASATIPLPATGWLMLAALGAVGAARRAAR